MKTKEELENDLKKAKEAQTKFKGKLVDKFVELEKKLTKELEELEAKEKEQAKEEKAEEKKAEEKKEAKKEKAESQKQPAPKKEKAASKPAAKKPSKVFNIIIDGEEVEVTPENCEKVLNAWNERKAKVKENADKKTKTNPVTRAVDTVKNSIETITNAVEKIVEEQVDKGITPAQEKTKISELNEIKELLKKLASLLSKFADKNVNIKSALSTLQESIETIKEAE